MQRLALTLLVVALLASSLLLVAAQHRARGLFVDLERAQQQAHQLEADGNRMRIELGRLSQPAAVEAAARTLGLEAIGAARTVYLPRPVADRAPAAAAAGNTAAGVAAPDTDAGRP